MASDHLRGSITSEDILGKDVIDSTGKMIGVTDKLYIDPKNFCVFGISVDKGFLAKGLLIGKDHVREIAKHAIFLDIQPAPELNGKQVFDHDGHLVGTVTKVRQQEGTNEIEELVIWRGMFRRRLHVSGANVRRAEKEIFLRVTQEELLRKPVKKR